MKYTPLHVYTGYSLLKSGLKLEDYIAFLKQNKFESAAITDFGMLSGAPLFEDELKILNIKSLVGEDLIIDGILFTFIVLSEDGYRNLLLLNSKYQKGQLTISDVQNNNTDVAVIIDISCENIKKKYYDDNKGFARYLASLTRGISSLYFGINHLVDSNYLKSMREFLFSHGYQTVAFPFIKYAKKEDALVLAMVETIETKAKLCEKKLNGDLYILSFDEIEKYYTKEEIEGTNTIANAVNFKLNSSRGELVSFENDLNMTSDQYIEKLCLDRLKELNLLNEKYKERLNYELGVISKMGYSDYFLIVRDYVKYSKDNNMLVGPGRGSAPGSLVTYLLGITDVDPIKNDLIFERFLNEHRKTMPDIDIDFEDIYRNAIVEYIKKRYGNAKIAKVMTFQKMGAKAALNDVQRIFDYPERDIKLFTKLIKDSDDSLREDYKKIADFKKLVDSDKYYLEIVSLASKLEGFPRQTGLHAAGIVINSKPLDNVIPISLDIDGTYIEQFEKEYLENQGFLKMDILAVNNLTIIDLTCRLLKQKGIDINPDTIPNNDPKSFEVIKKGMTTGLFQIDTAPMRKAIKTLKPSNLDDVVALLALNRPGPMSNIPEYARRKEGKSPVKYLSPSLKSILEPTYGIIVYQEQVMQIANKMAGFTFGEADLFRRAISKKDASKIAQLKTPFIQGSIKNGYKEQDATNVFNALEKFGDYGFNKSHSLCYAIFAVRMAYLKTYYPAEFYCAALSVSGSIDFNSLIFEMKSFGITPLAPDINKSTNMYQVIDKNKILFPLTSISKASSLIVNAIIKEREKGQFEDIFEFVVRMNKYKMSNDQLVNFINAGAFDSIESSRESLKASLNSAYAFANMVGDDDETSLINYTSFPKPSLIRKEDDKLTNLNNEYKSLGLMLSGSPLDLIDIDKTKFTTIDKIYQSNKTIKLCAVVKTVKKIRTKKGDEMAFIEIYDQTGETELTLFSRVFTPNKSIIAVNNVIIIEGFSDTRKEEFVVNSIEKGL